MTTSLNKIKSMDKVDPLTRLTTPQNGSNTTIYLGIFHQLTLSPSPTLNSQDCEHLDTDIFALICMMLYISRALSVENFCL